MWTWTFTHIRSARSFQGAGSCSVSAFSKHTAAIHLPRGALLFSPLLRCGRCLLWGNERSVTFPLLILSAWITPYFETQSACIRDHCAVGELKVGGTIKLLLKVQTRSRLALCDKGDYVSKCVKWKGSGAVIKNGKRSVVKMFVIRVTNGLFEVTPTCWTSRRGLTFMS